MGEAMDPGLYAAIVGAAATLAVGVLGFLQWLWSSRARARQRDKELFAWGGEVIQLMAAIEGQARPDALGDIAIRCETYAARASAMVDVGRLFFPNIQTRGLDFRPGQPAVARDAYTGHRVAILDEVLRAYHGARHLADHGQAADWSLYQHLRDARRRFVTHLQNEMQSSLRKTSSDMRGKPVPENPADW